MRFLTGGFPVRGSISSGIQQDSQGGGVLARNSDGGGGGRTQRREQRCRCHKSVPVDRQQSVTLAGMGITGSSQPCGLHPGARWLGAR